ncbi:MULTISPECIES: hypothetical protein [unclassified Streptomyces]|uniref:hypothetical protein n=1 Tax=unclassified Streptomyces TaxID=2593676 RepID=UPI0011A17E2C|nr:hypothetical protein [Streptomyces sp. BK340]TVZ88186.1 hypothetical protein FB157_115145 [Streptomyces sp. BK340]
MGVFARLLGRSKATQEAAPDEVQTGTESGAAEVVAEADRAAEAKGSAEDGREGEAAEAKATESGAAESAEIPKQQSADAAADSEAGESART